MIWTIVSWIALLAFIAAITLLFTRWGTKLLGWPEDLRRR